VNKINIAIDGFSGCGKSTLAKALADSLGYTFIDTGAMFRAIAYLIIKTSASSISDILSSKPKIEFDELGNIRLNGRNVSMEIRSSEVTQKVSEVAADSNVRNYLKQIQSEWISAKGVVMEGRDITSVIMPDAELKLFITADPLVRAQRRHKQLIDLGKNVTEADVLIDLQKRDDMDMARTTAPLAYASSAILMDTSNLSREEQLKAVLAMANPLIDQDRFLGSIKRL
jgi:cytidylate kinase